MNTADLRMIVQELTGAFDPADPGNRLQSIIITTRTERFQHDFYETAEPTDVRSISKVPVAMTIGIAIHSGLTIRGEPLSLDTKIWPFFEAYLPSDSDQNSKIRRVELRHLMNNTIGHRDGFLFRKDVADHDPNNLLNYIFATPIEYEPGTHFSYSNVGWYLVSALIKRELGISLTQWVSDQLLSRLDITNFEWNQYGDYEIGGSGLRLHNADLHKLGQLLLNHGHYNGQPIVPDHWLNLMHSPIARTTAGQDPARTLQYAAYGYSLWSTNNGIYYCDGSAGQYLIMIPDHNLVISTVGNVTNMNPISYALRGLLDRA